MNKTDVILLDFDGTLFPTRFIVSPKHHDPVLSHIINTLCEKLGFKIVISSSMGEQGRDRCEEILDHAGIDKSFLLNERWTIHDGTCNNTGERHMHIEKWLTKHADSIGQTVIFDDAPCPVTSPLRDDWFSCDTETGLRKHEVYELASRHPEILSHLSTDD